MMRRWTPWMLLLGALACAPTTGPTALPLDVLVVLDQQARSLRLILPDAPDEAIELPLSLPNRTPLVLSVHGARALVGYADTNVVQVIDLGSGAVIRTVTAMSDPRFVSVPPSAVLLTEKEGFVAYRSVDLVTRFDVATGATTAILTSGGPQGFGVARGTVFFVKGNRSICPPGCAGAPSWLTPYDPGRATVDSIPLFGPGNAKAAELGTDGFLYVLNSGDGNEVPGGLSLVDAVSRREIASFGGLGLFPTLLASDGIDRLLIASVRELMVFNVRDRVVVNGAGAGIPLTSPRALTTDAAGQIYVVEGGICPDPNARVRIFRRSLVERAPIPLGPCPVAAELTEIPVDQYGRGP